MTDAEAAPASCTALAKVAESPAAQALTAVDEHGVHLANACVNQSVELACGTQVRVFSFTTDKPTFFPPDLWKPVSMPAGTFVSVDGLKDIVLVDQFTGTFIQNKILQWQTNDARTHVTGVLMFPPAGTEDCTEFWRREGDLMARVNRQVAQARKPPGTSQSPPDVPPPCPASS